MATPNTPFPSAALAPLSVTAWARDELPEDTLPLVRVVVPDRHPILLNAAFSSAGIITEVAISAGVREISPKSFARCFNLKTVALPTTVRIIGREAFAGCRNLASIEIPDGVHEIAEAAFNGAGLESISVPGTVCFIGPGAFQSCRALKSVQLQNGLCQLGFGAFRSCWALTEVTLPRSVECINPYAFDDCVSLVSVTLPPTLHDISAHVLARCRRLTKIVIPHSVALIDDSAFAGCQSLVEVNMERCGPGIWFGSDVFRGCSNLVLAMLPTQIDRIRARSVFAECPRLQCVIGPPPPLPGSPDAADAMPAVWVDNTPAARHRVSVLRHWSRQTHHLCSPRRREWVFAVLLVARRLETKELPPLPFEMWEAVLGRLRRDDLGAVG
eukprot:m.469540 g.469540  ORF g.469540 m.469540 type:complete len:385 (+) comp28685_c0_seq1:98-1252(+)